MGHTTALRSELRDGLKTRLKSQGIKNARGKAIGALLDIREVFSFLIEYYEVPHGEVTFKFSLDGRPHGKKGELAVSVSPFFNHLEEFKQQSVSNIYPIGILEGKDNFETCEIFLESVDKALETIKTEGVKVGNLVYPIKIIHVYDLAAFWEITTITKFECPYGKDCRQHYRTNTQRARSSNMRPKKASSQIA